MIVLNNENFDELKNNGITLVDFYTTWCAPCKMMGSVLEEFEIENKDINIIKVDCDIHEELARIHGVMSVPTLVIYKDGEFINKYIGFQDKEHLKSLIEEIK